LWEGGLCEKPRALLIFAITTSLSVMNLGDTKSGLQVTERANSLKEKEIMGK